MGAGCRGFKSLCPDQKNLRRANYEVRTELPAVSTASFAVRPSPFAPRPSHLAPRPSPFPVHPSHLGLRRGPVQSGCAGHDLASPTPQASMECGSSLPLSIHPEHRHDRDSPTGGQPPPKPGRTSDRDPSTESGSKLPQSKAASPRCRSSFNPDQRGIEPQRSRSSGGGMPRSSRVDSPVGIRSPKPAGPIPRGGRDGRSGLLSSRLPASVAPEKGPDSASPGSSAARPRVQSREERRQRPGRGAIRPCPPLAYRAEPCIAGRSRPFRDGSAVSHA